VVFSGGGIEVRSTRSGGRLRDCHSSSEAAANPIDAPGECRRDRGRRNRRSDTFILQGFLEYDPSIADGLQTLLRFLAQAAADQLLKSWRRSDRQRVEIDLVLEHRRQDVGHRLALEELAAGEHLPQHHAEGPDVGPAVSRLARGLLGRHVGRRAENQARRRGVAGHGGRQRQARVAVIGLPRLGEPEVQHLDRAVGTELNVGRLEVAVDDPLFVCRLQRLRDLPRDGHRLFERNRSALDALGEVLPLHQLHCQKGRARPRTRPRSRRHRLQPVQRRDVGVVEARQHLRFALEARHAFGILGELAREHLERHLAAQLFILGAPHLAHPADAEGIDHAVVGKTHSRFDAHPVTPQCRYVVSNPTRSMSFWNLGSSSLPGM
jgi:hypothetical protein